MKLLPRFFALILVVASAIVMFACAQQPHLPSQKPDTPFDPEHPHLLLATDIQNGCIAVINLDAEDPMDPENYYWYWCADPSLGWNYSSKLIKNLSDARLRWSELHQSYVVLMTAANGWIGIAEYPSGKCIWETIYTGTSPHAIEMLPNGDLVVANSGGVNWETEGTLKYYHTTNGKRWTVTDTVELPSAHGVLWDPEYQVLWADGYSELLAFEIVTNDKGKQTLSQRTDGLGGLLLSGNGHDLMPDYSDPNLLWVTCDKAIYMYDKAADKVLSSYTYSDMLFGQYRVKGITTLADGIVAYAKCGASSSSSDWLNTIYVLLPQDTEGKEATMVVYTAQDGAYWNKVRNFDPDYQ